MSEVCPFLKEIKSNDQDPVSFIGSKGALVSSLAQQKGSILEDSWNFWTIPVKTGE